jgi:hypothetical protein
MLVPRLWLDRDHLPWRPVTSSVALAPCKAEFYDFAGTGPEYGCSGLSISVTMDGSHIQSVLTYTFIIASMFSLRLCIETDCLREIVVHRLPPPRLNWAPPRDRPTGLWLALSLLNNNLRLHSLLFITLPCFDVHSPSFIWDLISLTSLCACSAILVSSMLISVIVKNGLSGSGCLGP